MKVRYVRSGRRVFYSRRGEYHRSTAKQQLVSLAHLKNATKQIFRCKGTFRDSRPSVCQIPRRKANRVYRMIPSRSSSFESRMVRPALLFCTFYACTRHLVPPRLVLHARRVAGPTAPVAYETVRFWNALTAACVTAPK